MGDLRHAKYKELLIKLSDLIDARALEKMKFRCDGLIGNRERERIKSPLELWTSLEKREFIGESNLQFLKQLLQSCMGGNNEAMRLVESFEKSQQCQPMNGQYGIVPSQYDPPVQPPPVLQKEFSFLSSSLGYDWQFFVRELDVPESEIEMIRTDNRYTRDQIYQCLLLWYRMNQNTGSATRQKLIMALKEIRRMDLAGQMERGEY